MTTVRVELPPKLIPVFAGQAMYRGAYGGRGSAKTRSFAKMSAVRGLMCAQANEPGVIVCGREFQNSLDESSMAEVKAAIESEPWLREHYDVGEKYIRTADHRIDFAFIGLRHNLDSIKSKSRIRLLWVDEAEPVSETAWSKAINTVREEGAEIWVTWNPERKNSATHKRFRLDPPAESKTVELNWRDNPWFPSTLDKKRLEDKAKRPDQYEHVWEGDFVSVVEGAYYAASLTQAKAEGRIGNVACDPLMTVRAVWDIGGTGAKADACAIWICQFVGREIRVLDYYEAIGQPLASHVEWLRSHGYGQALCILPHDGSSNDKVYDVSYESALRGAGFEVKVVPNQGKGAAKMRIEAARRLFPSIWFNAVTTEAGRDALAWYHEKKSDDARAIGLGPEHDWSSHGCFEGSTKVLTRYGTYQIKNLPYRGEILTPCGWRAYIAPRITRRNARLVEVRFTSGYSVKCTPDHLFLTASGWKSAEHLTPNIAIRSTLTRSRSISMAASIVFGRATAIYRAAVENCTGMCGRALSALSPVGVTYTTATEMYSTTGLKTWNAWTRPSTCQLRGGRIGRELFSTLALRLGIKQPNGISRRRGGFGINGMPSAQRVGLNGSARRKSASIAESFISHWCAKAVTLANTVRKLVKLPHTDPAVNKTNGLAIIESVKLINETADVWDITVPSDHCFSLANGAVVHNSDAFGLMCVAYEEPKIERLRQQNRRVGSWMGI